MSNYLYFDSAATTAPCKEALQAVQNAYMEYGNPSSLHRAGMAAKTLLDTGKREIAQGLHCDPKNLILTSCGTEASNMAIFGLAATRGKRCKRILTTDSEHPSVEEPLKKLESEGFEVIRISTKGGCLNMDQFIKAIEEPVAFITMMQANNETGAIYDLEQIHRTLQSQRLDIPVHCDAVQSFLKIPNNRITDWVDYLTVSAHKVEGVKGAGALFVKNGNHVPAYLLGGGQESGLRSGTENVAAISAFGAAVKANMNDKERFQKIQEMHDFVLQRLSGTDIICHVPVASLSNILHISLPGIPSLWTLTLLSERGICVSAGSACSSRKKGNRVLEAYGLPKAEVESSIRISFSESNTIQECQLLCDALQDTLKLKKKV